MSITMTRSSFIAGSALALGAAANGITVPACADEPTASASSFEGFRAVDYADKVNHIVEADIVVVGAGMSGLAAALEAAQQGVRVALLESQEVAGGNGNMSDCMMSFGSPQMIAGAEAEGVEVTAGQIIRGEVELFNYNCDGAVWCNILAHSADNTQWLIDAGVQFAEQTVYYGGSAETPTALMWRDGVGSGALCAVAPLVEAVVALGVEPMYSTRAKALKVDEAGAVCGVYAEGPEGVVEVDAKAVILAGGGWVANTEMVQRISGMDVNRHILFCAPGCQGDTLMMASAIGAREDAAGRGYMSNAMVAGLNIYGLPKFGAGVWVNETGSRFANEDCSDEVYDYICSAIYNQNQAWIVIDEPMIALFDQQNPNPSGGADSLRAATDEALAAGVPTVVKADTLEELAEAMGVDVEQFLATVEAYNGFVAAGYDDQFAKKPENLVAIETAPFYGYANVLMCCLSLGGINTNASWQVVDTMRKPIAGLYSVGADGQMVYKTQYNLKTSGGHMALNIESGRYAAKHAIENCL